MVTFFYDRNPSAPQIETAKNIVQETSPTSSSIVEKLLSTTKLGRKFSEKVFFYCKPLGFAEKTPYHHQLIVLAEGFKSLGIPVFSNINYWQLDREPREYLFYHDPEVKPEDCSIVVLDNEWFEHGSSFPQDLFHSKRQYATVYIDASDGLITRSWQPEFRQFDFIFKSHFNSHCLYPKNFHPGAFGISNRILKATEVDRGFKQRTNGLVVNFRVPHPVRETVRQKIFPVIENILPIDESIDSLATPPKNSRDYLDWIQTGRRHYPNYYKRLKNSVGCASFGGYFIPAWPSDPVILTNPLGRIANKISNKLDWLPKRVMQWDSWRLWESLAAGCATFHVDFEKYGLHLPVMPGNWQQYVGIDLDNLQEAMERIADEPDILEKISTQGRIWAIEHYSPIPTALRFLETVCK